MRVAVDYTSAIRQGGGIGRYTRELIAALLAASHPHTFTLMAAVAGKRAAWNAAAARLGDRATLRPLPLTDDWMARLWQRLRLPLPAEWLTGPVDCFYSPDFVLPPLRRATRALLTVHDLSFLRHPETFTPALRAYLERSVPRSVTRADHVFADSHATRADLIALLDVPPERVTTLHCGVSARFTPQEAPGERERLAAQYGVGARPYILAVGTVQPRKNYIRLMTACDALVSGRDLDLVIAGGSGWLAEAILEAAAQRPYVRITGFFADGDLPALYRQAALLAFPSIYEGFGLPPLEAMACGTPVVASTASSVPEAVGDAGLQVDPHDSAAWTAALARALDDAELRAHLREAGLARAATFTWVRAARHWLDTLAAITGNAV